MKKIIVLFSIIIANFNFAQAPIINPIELPLSFTLRTASFNSIDIGSNSRPSFTDLDGDGLLDMLVNKQAKTISHYEQNAANSTSFTLVTESFNGINTCQTAPAFTDIDGDGLLDMFFCSYDAQTLYVRYEQVANNSTSFTLITNNFNNISGVGNNLAPAFTDLDGDGLLDMLLGEGVGNINHYEQNANNSILFTLVTESFNGIDVGSYSTPTFTDLDGDGLLDMLVGEETGNINHYEQDALNSTSFTLVTESFSGIDVGNYSVPTFPDLDGDELLDMVVGEMSGTLYHYEQDVVSAIDFGNILTGNSSIINYLIKATNLTSNLSITASSEFTISLSEGSGYTQSLSLSPVDGKVSDTIFVKFSPPAKTDYSGQITHTSTAAETKYISLTGAGTEIDNFPGNALEFDGVNDYVNIKDNNSLDLVNNYTIEAWIKPETFTSMGGIVSKYQSVGANGYFLRLSDTSPYTGLTFDGLSTSNGILESGKWYHVAAVNDNGTRRLYLNGIEQALTGTASTINANTDSLCIGVDYKTSGRYFAGKVEEVRIWNTARTVVNILESMHLPLVGTETGLVSYWQCNEGSGTTVSDVIRGNDGVLTNMDDTDWINSTIPFGDGYSDTHSVSSTGGVAFTNTDLSMNITEKTGTDVLVVTKINRAPNIGTDPPAVIFDAQYWIIHKDGSGTITTDLTFTLSENLTYSDESDPAKIKLYGRNSSSDLDWIFIKNAASVNAVGNSATFTGITSFSQFVLARESPSVITLLDLPYSKFDLITTSFNGIDVGGHSTPTFTDLDGDNLLDMLVGKLDGKINHYEQNALNSTSFTLVTDYFNGIDVLDYSIPTFTDLDGDDLLDMLIGRSGGNIWHYEQNAVNSTSFTLITTGFSGSNEGSYSAPIFTDIDGDGLLDMFLGEQLGNINHLEQNAVNSTSFTLITESFNGIDVGLYSTPTFTDLNGDGLLDMFVGEADGNINHYEQDALNSPSFTLVTESFEEIDVGSRSAPSFTDLDGDGLLDMLVGEADGTLYHYEQNAVSAIDFRNIQTGNSSVFNYYINGQNLPDLSITSTSEFTISLSEGSGYTQSLSLSPVDGKVSDTIFVKFSPPAKTDYSGQITHTSTGAETKYISLTGTGAEIDNFPGNALEFDGVNDYVNIKDNNSLDLVNNYTIEAWIKPAAFSMNGGIVSKFHTAGANGYYLRLSDTSPFTGLTFDGLSTSNGILEPGKWYHVAAVNIGGSRDLYLNGVEQVLTGTAITVGANTNPLCIGVDYKTSGTYFAGDIDEVKIWSVARSVQAIREGMHRTLDTTEAGLVSYWQFNDGSGSGILGDIAHGYIGTLTNMDNTNAWITSPIPGGGGTSNSGNISFTGSVSLGNVQVTTTEAFDDVVNLVNTEINRSPNSTTGIAENALNKYFVIHAYGTPGSFSVTLTFTLPEGNISITDQSTPSNLKLYSRESNADGSWTLVTSASSATSTTVTFNGITSFSQFIIASATSPLPVALKSFTVNVMNNTVQLNWQTATEVNNYGFEVERTSPRPSPYQGEGGEAGRGWEKIGFVEGHGNSNSPKDYSFEDKSVESGKCSYRLKQIDNDGGFRYSQEVEVKVEAIPTEFALFQNYPNPFNPSTTIKFSLPETGYYSLKIFNTLGEEVAQLINGQLEGGNYRLPFDASKLASGVYIYNLKGNNVNLSMKMTLMK